MSEWGKARKKPLEVEFREPIPKGREVSWEGETFKVEWIKTLEGFIYARPGRDYVIRGIKGELYPIKINIFNETYDTVEPLHKQRNIKDQKVNKE